MRYTEPLVLYTNWRFSLATELITHTTHTAIINLLVAEDEDLEKIIERIKDYIIVWTNNSVGGEFVPEFNEWIQPFPFPHKPIAIAYHPRFDFSFSVTPDTTTDEVRDQAWAALQKIGCAGEDQTWQEYLPYYRRTLW